MGLLGAFAFRSKISPLVERRPVFLDLGVEERDDAPIFQDALVIAREIAGDVGQRLVRLFRSVMEIVREVKCAPGREDDIELALTEALANAVIHGAKGDPSKIIECDVACDGEGAMLIVVRDPGPGFDPSKIADPCHGENIYSNHGRGIYLINQLMDEVRFHKNGTEIHMLKR